MSRSILLYGDVDLRYVDGSAIWLLSMARVLAQTKSRVFLLLKSARGQGGLFEDLANIPNLEIIDDFTAKAVRGPRYQPLMASRRIEQLVVNNDIDFVLCRGLQVCTEVAKLPNAGPRLWAYMTDVPQKSSSMDVDITSTLANIAATASRVLVQTDEAREFLEFHVPAARQKTVLLPPMIPTELADTKQRTQTSQASISHSNIRPIRLVYAGKFAKMWNTLEMCDLPMRAAQVGIPVELTLIGDKFQNDPDDTGWAARMKHGITNSYGVKWIGSMSRLNTLNELRNHDYGLAWRDPQLDTSHELSTKLLEYAACGIPPLVNRTAMHQRILGVEYPLFIDQSDIISTIQSAYDLRDSRQQLVALLNQTISPYWMANRAEALESILSDTRKIPTSLYQEPSIDVYSTCCDSRTDLLSKSLGLTSEITVRAIDMSELDELPGPSRTSSIIVIDSFAEIDRIPSSTPIWLYWHPALQSQPRPARLKIDGVIVDGFVSRMPAAHWSGQSIAAVHSLPFTLKDHPRPKIDGSENNIAMMIQEMNATELDTAYQLTKRLRERDSRLSVHIYVADTRIDGLSKWQQELVVDTLERITLDPVTAGSWCLSTTAAASTWLRKFDWVVYSDYESLPPELRNDWGSRSTELIPLKAGSDADSIADAAYKIVSQRTCQLEDPDDHDQDVSMREARVAAQRTRLTTALRASCSTIQSMHAIGPNR